MTEPVPTPTTATKTDFDVQRATAIINIGMQHRWVAEGAMPESDADKIIEAERLYALALQANEVAQAIGKQNVPDYEGIEAILFEAQVLVGANGNSNGSEAPSPTPSSSSDSPPPVSVPSPPELGQQTLPSPPTTEELSPGASSPPQDSSPSAPSSEGLLPEPQVNERWADPNGSQWDVLRDLGHQVQVRSVVTGEGTLVPKGFLKTKVIGPSTYIDVEARPMDNALVYTHPGCGKWIVPLDDVILPAPGTDVECDSCSQLFPIREVNANGYVSPHAPAAPAPEPQPDPETSSTDAHAGDQPAGDEPLVHAKTPSSEALDDENDEEYAKVIARVEANFAPAHMPAPQDLENPPAGMPDDLTADETANRALHSQFNALAARARFLYSFENALARDCGRVRDHHFKGALREARRQAGKDATLVELRAYVETNSIVQAWTRRHDHHADRADAYKTFMEIYNQNVSVLSRDLTWASAEERGS